MMLLKEPWPRRGPRLPRRRMLLFISASAALIGAIVVWAVIAGLSTEPIHPGRPTETPPAAGPPRLQDGLGSYAAAVYTADGRIDIGRTVARLKEVGANRYYYLIWDRRHPGEPTDHRPGRVLSQSEWDQL